ncbi:hypothetical protein IKG02_01880 [Candidatus Saccharibacteria bacterium]|nr:hypothetical protein [Candidatus Saccharibacteria bacterium]
MQFDEGFLREVGLIVMPENERKAFLEYAQEELEVRIGEEIAEGMTEEQMREFEESASDEEAEKWLVKNKPNYRDIVKRNILELREEISRNRKKILGEE